MPNYDFVCGNCGYYEVANCLIEERDAWEATCNCGGRMSRCFTKAPNVMNTALPDGTKRFSHLKAMTKLELERVSTNNPAERSRIAAEIRKTNKRS